MLRWLYRLLDRRYNPYASIAPLSTEEWSGLLVDLADGYTKHEPVFRALQHVLHATERKAFDIPKLKTAEDFDVWGREQYGVAREANMLRYALRLPLEGAKRKARFAKEQQAKEAAEKAPKPADLD